MHHRLVIKHKFQILFYESPNDGMLCTETRSDRRITTFLYMYLNYFNYSNIIVQLNIVHCAGNCTSVYILIYLRHSLSFKKQQSHYRHDKCQPQSTILRHTN
jgi:hypothetical protein